MPVAKITAPAAIFKKTRPENPMFYLLVYTQTVYLDGVREATRRNEIPMQRKSPVNLRSPGNKPTLNYFQGFVGSVGFGSVAGIEEAVSGGLVPAELALAGLEVSLNRVRYGMNGVTSNGIFSRSATAPIGLLLMSSRRSYHTSSFTRPPIGRAAIVCGFCLGSASGAFTSAIPGTRSPRCALIRFGISFWRVCKALKKSEAFVICQFFATCGSLRALANSSPAFLLAASSSAGVRAKPKCLKVSLSSTSN